MMTIGSLFSGIGGLELGFECSGLGPVIWQVEKDPYCLKVLEKHWPHVKRYKDVKEVDSSAKRPDLICGGFPCQDISGAGKGAGLAGVRSGLWFEFARILREIQPEWVVVENVGGAAIRWVDPVRWHLELLGYKTIPIPLSAQDVGAPHCRKRVFIVARNATDPASERSQKTVFQREPPSLRNAPHCNRWAAKSSICRVDDGTLDRTHRIRVLGNAVVPQCAEVIGYVVQQLYLERLLR